ncbi:MAG: LapA family protein [Marmoricola sp.]|nr:LapA family protein [Marmoricola sp.]
MTDPSSPAPVEGSTETAAPDSTGRPDPLRTSRTSSLWTAALVLVVLLLLLAIFILQNTQRVKISFFGWTGHAPLAASLLIAAVAGAVVVASAGVLRILQLRRRVKRERRH